MLLQSLTLEESGLTRTQAQQLARNITDLILSNRELLATNFVDIYTLEKVRWPATPGTPPCDGWCAMQCALRAKANEGGALPCGTR